MAKLAEGIARVADGISMGRRQRGELAAEIKATTRSRRSDVRSFLESVNTSRSRASRDQATEAEEGDPSAPQRSSLVAAGFQDVARQSAPRGSKEAAAINSRRQSEVKALLTQFGREQVARHKHRQDTAAAFMRDLTSGVAALLDSFDKGNRNRASALRKRFGAYALDRGEAIAIWRGSSRRGQQAGAQTSEASHRPAAERAAAHANRLPRLVRTLRRMQPPVPLRILPMRRLVRASPPLAIWVNPSSKGHHGGHSK